MGVSVGILYYTDNRLDERIMAVCQDWIKRGAGTNRIVSVSLQPIDFGENTVLPLERGILTMFTQMLVGLKILDTDVVFLCEHDVLYHPSHFDFEPSDKAVFYYDSNIWRVRLSDGFAVRFDHKSVSQMCAWRETLVNEYENRVRRVRTEGFRRSGYEPGTKSLRRGGYSNSAAEWWRAAEPTIDIRHDRNQSSSRWRQEDFNSLKSCQNWQEGTADQLWAGDILRELRSYG